MKSIWKAEYRLQGNAFSARKATNGLRKSFCGVKTLGYAYFTV